MKKFLLFIALLFSATLHAANHPNVIVILTDDQGWGDVSLHGNSNLSTPHIDSLAEEGAQFDRFYVSPVCSPTRAEFLTGRYHPRSGVYSTSAGGERLDLDETTIADVFRTAGYSTGAFGKWHNGMQYPYHPNGRGFDEYYGFCSGHWGDYFSPMLEHNGKIVQGEGFVVDDFTDKAMDFMEAQVKAGKPFFTYLPYNTPHSPMQVPDEFWEKFADMDLEMQHRDPGKEDIGHIRAALAMCENIDWNVGRLLQKLDELEIAEDTIIVYFHDNGPNGWRWNGDMAGRKGSTDEGGVRSPLFIRWSGSIEAGVDVKELAAGIDLLPTLTELAGIEMKTAKPVDGQSLKSAIMGEADASLKDRMIVSHWKGKTSVRTPEFRLSHQGKLFDMEKDPGQRVDVTKQHPDVARELKAAVNTWEETVLAELGEDNRPFVIGHPESTFTQVPARDAEGSGEIQRSNKFPNDSFFRNWKNTEDVITWDVEVAEAGDYEAVIYYALKTDDVGATVELSFEGASVSKTLTEANDVPLRGMEDDRVERMESYTKDFKPATLGTLKLAEGSGSLVLRSTEIPGDESIEFRLLMLERK